MKRSLTLRAFTVAFFFAVLLGSVAWDSLVAWIGGTAGLVIGSSLVVGLVVGEWVRRWRTARVLRRDDPLSPRNL